MPIIDSQTNQVVKEYSLEELAETARLGRALLLTSLHCAGSGHSGGCLSSLDFALALYLKKMRHDPKNFQWENRDRCFWSVGHKAPLLYLSLALSGYDIFPGYKPTDALMTLRKLGSPLQGHPDWKLLSGVEHSSGSLGQGPSVAAGSAKAAKLNGTDYKVYCLNGDGEMQEGQIWEAAMSVADHGLDNLTLFVDYNGLQIDGRVKEVMNIDPLGDKFRAFGWHVSEINGHDFAQILNALDEKTEGKPKAIIGHTIKGKGVSFMENQAGWHGKAPDRKQLKQALSELGFGEWIANGELEQLIKISNDSQKKIGAQLLENVPEVPSRKKYFWNPKAQKDYFLFQKGDLMQVEMEPTRFGFGRALQRLGDDKRIVCLGEDISGSISILDFLKEHPERKDRFVSVGIAEANAKSIAAGLAKEGFLPVEGNYGTFSTGRSMDQLRTTVCYGKFNVLTAVGHAGVSVGPDGATHQSLEDVSLLLATPEISYVVPCDSLETDKATEALLYKVIGPKAIRFAREATPIVTRPETLFVFGEANLINYLGEEKPNFIDAFSISLASESRNSDQKIPLTIITNGPMVAEAMRASRILRQEYDIASLVLNLHTLKVPGEQRANKNHPFSDSDCQAIYHCAKHSEVIITLEEHQVGGFGDPVSAVILEADLHPKFKRLGISDRFGESGAPWELTYHFGLAAESVAEKARKLLGG